MGASKKGSGGQKRAASSASEGLCLTDTNPLLTFQGAIEESPDDPDSIDYVPDYYVDRGVSMLDTLIAKGNRDDMKPSAHIIKIPTNDATLETCGVIVTMGDTMYAFRFDADLPHSYVLSGPSKKSGERTWVKKVHGNIDIGHLFDTIRRENKVDDLEWMDDVLHYVSMPPTQDEPVEKKRKPASRPKDLPVERSDVPKPVDEPVLVE